MQLPVMVYPGKMAVVLWKSVPVVVKLRSIEIMT